MHCELELITSENDIVFEWYHTMYILLCGAMYLSTIATTHLVQISQNHIFLLSLCEFFAEK